MRRDREHETRVANDTAAGVGKRAPTLLENEVCAEKERRVCAELRAYPPPLVHVGVVDDRAVIEARIVHEASQAAAERDHARKIGGPEVVAVPACRPGVRACFRPPDGKQVLPRFGRDSVVEGGRGGSVVEGGRRGRGYLM